MEKRKVIKDENESREKYKCDCESESVNNTERLSNTWQRLNVNLHAQWNTELNQTAEGKSCSFTLTDNTKFNQQI